MKNKSKIWKRNCPNCETELKYQFQSGYSYANKKNSECSSCSKLGDKNNNYWKDKHRSDKTKEKISKSLKGIIPNELSRKRMRIATIKRISESKFNGNQFYPNYNPYSISIIEQKANELGITDLQHAENGGEYHIKELGYFVDGYSKEKNMVIEFYEKFHEKNMNKDLQRQKEIMNLLKCEFIIIEE